jgi:hypothetical protein
MPQLALLVQHPRWLLDDPRVIHTVAPLPGLCLFLEEALGQVARDGGGEGLQEEPRVEAESQPGAVEPAVGEVDGALELGGAGGVGPYSEARAEGDCRGDELVVIGAAPNLKHEEGVGIKKDDITFGPCLRAHPINKI